MQDYKIMFNKNQVIGIPGANFAPAMQTHSLQPSSRPVAIWLLIGVAMIIIQVLLGGITRLTGSGLSITEWDAIQGALPPLNEHQWMELFDKYKQTPQYRLINFDFTLQNFKFIFFWEWFHRLWARLIGVVFLIPFIIFLIQRRFRADMIRPMVILFILGGLQGAIGWIMVASGLTGSAVYVEPVKLALHFIFALGLLCYTFWFALQLLVPGQKTLVHARINKLVWISIALLVIQLFFGALMAGHRAAVAAPTWPDINGGFIPASLWYPRDGMMNLVSNRITIHFVHRNLGYIIFLLGIFLSVQVYRNRNSSTLIRKSWWIPFSLLLLQVILGVLAVLKSIYIVAGKWGVFEWAAQLHQLTAMFILLSLVWLLFIIRRK